MLNGITQFFLKKEIILIVKHRNSTPLINDANKAKYIFISPLIFWKSTAIFGRNSKIRYRAMAVILNIISPKYIININWITRLDTLYFVWCKQQQKKFIVVQHGSYVAGLITDIPHRVAKCNIFLAWSEYFKETLEKYNKGKKLDCIVWGNPVYNQYNRDTFSYKPEAVNKILVAPSLLTGERLKSCNALLKKLDELDFDVTVKEHVYQSVRSASIEGYAKVSGDLFSILKAQIFDIIITDVSSAMNDIIFFKTRAIFFSPPGNQDFYIENVYSQFMKNMALDIDSVNSRQVLTDYIDINAQENLLKYLVSPGNNNLEDL